MSKKLICNLILSAHPIVSSRFAFSFNIHQSLPITNDIINNSLLNAVTNDNITGY